MPGRASGTALKKPGHRRLRKSPGRDRSLTGKARAGEIDLAYFDESGFSVNPVLRAQWNPRGHPRTVLPRSHHRRFSVLGLLVGVRDLVWSGSWERIDAAPVIAFFDRVADSIRKKTVVILDNARIHHARDVRAKQPQWAEKGLEFFFLPPYSPELNRIEIVWKKAKHFWLPFPELSNSELEDRLSDILGGFGSTYTVTFC